MSFEARILTGSADYKVGFVLPHSEKAFDCGQQASRLVGFAYSGIAWGFEPFPPIGHDMAQGFNQVGIRFKDAFHRLVTNLQNLSFFEGNDICRPWFAREKSHLAKKIPLI
jgi:hypothetical protein